MNEADRELLQRCAARLDILELFGRYCQIIDRCDWRRLEEVFTADVDVDFSATSAYVQGNDARIKGLDKLIEFYEVAMAHIGPGVTYFMTGHVIDIQGDEARASCFSQTLSFSYGGVYRVEAKRGAQGWRFSKLVYEWRRFDDVMGRIKAHMETRDAQR